VSRGPTREQGASSVKPERTDQIATAVRTAALGLMNRQNFRDQELLLSSVVAAAVETVPGADAGGISMVNQGDVDAHTPSSAAVTTLDKLQSELHEGPCITAIEEPLTDGLVVVDDLARGDRERWPRFAPEAVEQGYRAMLGVQLFQQDEMQAALNLYASEPAAFDAHAQMTAELFGVQAATLIYGAAQTQQLEAAVGHRELIGQAKGILIQRYGVSGDEAFEMLVTSSQRSAIGLADIASWVVGEAEKQGQGGSDRPFDDH
jgi:hypothetical protein